MRLFVALDLDEKIRQTIEQFVAEVRSLAPGVRWVSTESLHITLKFIGEYPDAKVKDIEASLDSVSVNSAFRISFSGCGFFPTAKSARVFWIGIAAEPNLQPLAASIDKALLPLGVPQEKRAFSPHLTLARDGGGSGAPHRQRGDKPNRQFAPLQARLSEIPPPEFGTMTAREFFLYHSRLSPKGSEYTKVASFPLTASEP